MRKRTGGKVRYFVWILTSLLFLLCNVGCMREFTDSGLNKFNYPLAGMGTGIIYFDGNFMPTRWDIGILGDPLLMAENSLFAICINDGGQKTLRVLQGESDTIYRHDSFMEQPVTSNRSSFGKQGNYFIGTAEVPPNYKLYNDTKTGVIESDIFIMPSNCRKVSALIGGGNNIDKVYLALVDATTGNIIQKLTGGNTETMTRKYMDIGSAYAGKPVFFRIVDIWGAGWGHINVDDIKLLDANDQVVSSGFVNGNFETGDLTGWRNVNLPRIRQDGFENVKVNVGYPIVKYIFADPALPVDAEVELFSPMVPLNERDSTIPAGIFTVKLTNKTSRTISVSLLSTLANGLKGTARSNVAYNNSYGKYIIMTSTGFTDGTMEEGSLCLWTDAPGTTYSAGAATVDNLLNQIYTNGQLDGKATGNGQTPVAGLAVPVTLAAGESKSVSFTWTWYFPHMRGMDIWGGDPTDVSRRYVNYYNNVAEVMQDVKYRWSDVVEKTRLYQQTLYDSNLPDMLIDAVASNTDILRSPVLFVTRNGELYGWEGSDTFWGDGLCHGNCMHVWNYNQTLPNLYPELARRWKTLDFTRQQRPDGRLNTRIASVPAPYTPSGQGPFVDGNFGTIAGAYREHLNSPDNSFLSSLWHNIKAAMDGGIAYWDLDGDGVNERAEMTTLDGIISGKNTFTGAQYLAALRASEEMAKIMGDNDAAARYNNLFRSGRTIFANDTFNGEYFYQAGGSEYGNGVLSDHLLGQTYAFLYGLGYLLDEDMVRSSLNSVHKYNFFSPIGNRYSPSFGDAARIFAHPDDDGLLMCTFPKGGSGTANYLREDWPGVDYQVATSLIYLGEIDKAMDIINAVRSRHDGIGFDPLNERECGGYYARSLSSYGILVAATGIEKDGPRKILGFKPNMNPDDIKAFFTYVSGWGTFEQRREVSGNVLTQVDRIYVKYGHIDLRTLQFYIPERLKWHNTNIQATVKVDGAVIGATRVVSGDQVKLTFASDVRVNSGSIIETTITVTDNGFAAMGFDFGTHSSPVASGFIKVTNLTKYTEGRFGWTDVSGNQSRDRGSGSDLQRDFVFNSAARVFRIDLPNGNYNVKVTQGDASCAHDQMEIKANGVVVASQVNTQLGQWIESSFQVNVNDGSLRLEFSDKGGSDVNWVLNAITVTKGQ